MIDPEVQNKGSCLIAWLGVVPLFACVVVSVLMVMAFGPIKTFSARIPSPISAIIVEKTSSIPEDSQAVIDLGVVQKQLPTFTPILPVETTKLIMDDSLDLYLNQILLRSEELPARFESVGVRDATDRFQEEAVRKAIWVGFEGGEETFEQFVILCEPTAVVEGRPYCGLERELGFHSEGLADVGFGDESGIRPEQVYHDSGSVWLAYTLVFRSADVVVVLEHRRTDSAEMIENMARKVLGKIEGTSGGFDEISAYEDSEPLIDPNVDPREITLTNDELPKGFQLGELHTDAWEGCVSYFLIAKGGNDEWLDQRSTVCESVELANEQYQKAVGFQRLNRAELIGRPMLGDRSIMLQNPDGYIFLYFTFRNTTSEIFSDNTPSETVVSVGSKLLEKIDKSVGR